MKGKNIRLDELFQKYLEHDISEHELAEFSGYVDDPVFSEDLQELLGIAFQKGNEILSIGDPGRSRVLENILGAEPGAEKPKRIPLWLAMAAVAAAIVFIFFGVYFFSSQTKPGAESHYANDVKPGTVGATLTLSNGQKISLTQTANGKLAEEAGILVSKTADGQLVYQATTSAADPDKINTLSTAKGETYQLRLPDGSLVWLNAASSLTYLASLNERGRRIVKLSGEAYFEVFKDKIHPFIVETDQQRVEVLGTHFNINSYADEPVTATTLLEGSVKVISSSGGNSQTHILKPDEQALNDGRAILVKMVDTDNITDWKDGDFIFKDQELTTTMRQIARWYDVEINYEPDAPKHLKLGGSVSRANPVSIVLKAMEKTGKVKFKIEGRRISVSKK